MELCILSSDTILLHMWKTNKTNLWGQLGTTDCNESRKVYHYDN